MWWLIGIAIACVVLNVLWNLHEREYWHIGLETEGKMERWAGYAFVTLFGPVSLIALFLFVGYHWCLGVYSGSLWWIGGTLLLLAILFIHLRRIPAQETFSIVMGRGERHEGIARLLYITLPVLGDWVIIFTFRRRIVKECLAVLYDARAMAKRDGCFNASRWLPSWYRYWHERRRGTYLIPSGKNPPIPAAAQEVRLTGCASSLFGIGVNCWGEIPIGHWHSD